MWETRVWSLGQEDPLEKAMAIHSSIFSFEIPRTEDPGGLQSMGSQRVGHDWETELNWIINFIINYHLYIFAVPGTVLSTLYAIVLFQPYYKAVRKVLLLSSFYRWARGGFPGGSMLKNPPALQESWVLYLGQEDLMEKEMTAHSSILAWKTPWTEESGRLQSMGVTKELDTTK